MGKYSRFHKIPEQEQPKRIVWEYKSTGTFVDLEGKSGGGWNCEPFNAWGADGWELVSTQMIKYRPKQSDTETDTAYIFGIFKRPKVDSPACFRMGCDAAW